MQLSGQARIFIIALKAVYFSQSIFSEFSASSFYYEALFFVICIMKPNYWSFYNEKEWLRWRETLKQERDYPDKEAKVCRQFGCKDILTLQEQLCGEFCQLHSNLPKKSQPHGPEDPVLFVSY